MDWSRIKTIFIITFLILDVYLLYQFMLKRDANQYEFMTETPVEQKLSDVEITYPDMPKTAIKGQYVSANLREFTQDETKKLEDKGQTVKIRQKTLISSEFDTPYQLDSDFKPISLSGFLRDNILYGNEYQFWEKDEDEKTITYFQQYKGQFFYQSNGMIVFHLNEDNQITGYEQTFLDGIKKLNVKDEILKPLKALEVLHQKGQLAPKSRITKVELGYSTYVPLASSQVYAPTWRFVVNNEKSLYVNAFEGQVVELDSDENKVTE